MRTVFLLLVFCLDCLSGLSSFSKTEAATLTLPAQTQQWSEMVVEGIDPTAESFVLEVQIDPVIVKGGDLQVVAGFAVGLNAGERVEDGVGGELRIDLREGVDRAAFNLWHRKSSLTMQQPNPKPAGWRGIGEYQRPNVLPIREMIGHRMKLVVWPDGDGSRVRLFVDFDDRPVEDHRVNQRIRAGVVKLFAMRGGQDIHTKRSSELEILRAETINEAGAAELPAAWESILQAIDLSHPTMVNVNEAIQNGRLEEARSLFLDHMRKRQEPFGPSLEEAEATAIHPAWKTVADEALCDRYGTIGYFADFASEWTDTTGQTYRWVLQNEPLQVNWPRCNGHLNRHFHWVALAKAWDETRDPAYAKRFSAEVLDWVSREPFFWEQCPTVGGVNLMDGTIFKWGFMNTSNIGRRLELTWWPAYEVFRSSPDFSDDAHFAMLLGMLRQARLIMNPSSFAAHDDGGAHTTLALLQTSLLLPELKESKEWKATATQRWDVLLKTQFHPDGSHVSLSTGYNWASITALENYLRLYKRFGTEPPAESLEFLAKAAEHPMMLTAPDQAQIDLNDGGWSTIEDRYEPLLQWFPDRDDFRWMATNGKEGSRPKQNSIYFPNAGQYVMRTGWGPDDKYLFFGAGPWGASHGKFDALNIYAQFGDHLLIRNAGRGSYSGVGNTKHAGKSLSFNTLSPDWAQENSIPQWKHDMDVGFNPPRRRWVSNESFDYGEGVFQHGWYNAKEHIQGKWIRQVVFVKGNDARRDGYYIVIDSVEPADNRIRTWRHPWQLGLNAPNVGTRAADRSTTAIASVAALQILPVGDMTLRVIRGQERPELLGWRVYDTTANPWPVPTYEWQADAVFSRAWVIQMQATESDWPVKSVQYDSTSAGGDIRFTIHRSDGGTDHVLRRTPGQPPVDFHGDTTEGDVTVICTNANGNELTRLELNDVEDSITDQILP